MTWPLVLQSVDADMFRYGQDEAAQHLNALEAAGQAVLCSNCNVQASNKQAAYKVYDVAASSTCSIGVLGILNGTEVSVECSLAAVRSGSRVAGHRQSPPRSAPAATAT